MAYISSIGIYELGKRGVLKLEERDFSPAYSNQFNLTC